MRRHRLTAPEDENLHGVCWCMWGTILPGNGDVASTWAHSLPVLWDTWANFLQEWFKGWSNITGKKGCHKTNSSTLGEPSICVLRQLFLFPAHFFFSGYFLLLKLWLSREQLAWTVPSSESCVSSLFSYLQSSLMEDIKSLACSQIRKPISYLCIPC